MEKKRVQHNTTLDESLMKRMKILAAEKGCRVNDLLEAAIEDFLHKHAPQDKKPRKQKTE